jgi:hypothetical protein
MKRLLLNYLDCECTIASLLKTMLRIVMPSIYVGFVASIFQTTSSIHNPSFRPANTHVGVDKCHCQATFTIFGACKFVWTCAGQGRRIVYETVVALISMQRNRIDAQFRPGYTCCQTRKQNWMPGCLVAPRISLQPEIPMLLSTP